MSMFAKRHHRFVRLPTGLILAEVMVVVAVAGLLALLPSLAVAETVYVKYRGPIDLAPFSCQSVTRSSLVQRVCYDRRNAYMVINLNGTYYHYCEIDATTVQGLERAPSKRQFFETRIRGTGADGPFDCRTHPIPKKYRQ